MDDVFEFLLNVAAWVFAFALVMVAVFAFAVMFSTLAFALASFLGWWLPLLGLV